MHEYFPKHLRMRTGRMEKDKETNEEGKKRSVCMERSKARTIEKISDDGLNYPNQNTTIINIIFSIYKIWK